MAIERLYLVTTKAEPVASRLILATTKNQVEAMLTAETWTIEPADALEAAKLAGSGLKIETANGKV